MRLRHVLHRHRLAGQQPAGRRLFRPPREDRRQVLAEASRPGRTHLGDPAPDPAVGVRAPAVLPFGPSPLAVQRSGPAENPFRPAAQDLPPALGERPQPDRAAHARTPPRGQLRAALPSRGPVAQAGPVRPREALRQDRALAVGRRPVVGNARRRQAKDPGRETLHTDAGKQKEAVVAHDLADVGHAGVGRPADEAVARPELDPGRSEADAAQHPVPLRADPVPDLPSRRATPPLRMMRLDHRLPAAAILRFLGQARKELARRRKAQHADVAKPVLPLAEFASQRGPRQLTALAGRAEPLHRLRRDLTHANLHGRVIRTESGPESGVCR